MLGLFRLINYDAHAAIRIKLDAGVNPLALYLPDLGEQCAIDHRSALHCWLANQG